MAFWHAAEVLYANLSLYQTEYFNVCPVLHLQNLLIPGYIMEYYPTIEKNETAICNDVNRLNEYFS